MTVQAAPEPARIGPMALGTACALCEGNDATCPHCGGNGVDPWDEVDDSGAQEHDVEGGQS